MVMFILNSEIPFGSYKAENILIGIEHSFKDGYPAFSKKADITTYREQFPLREFCYRLVLYNESYKGIITIQELEDSILRTFNSGDKYDIDRLAKHLDIKYAEAMQNKYLPFSKVPYTMGIDPYIHKYPLRPEECYKKDIISDTDIYYLLTS
jgi:hypothetical protein